MTSYVNFYFKAFYCKNSPLFYTMNSVRFNNFFIFDDAMVKWVLMAD